MNLFEEERVKVEEQKYIVATFTIEEAVTLCHELSTVKQVYDSVRKGPAPHNLPRLQEFLDELAKRSLT